MKKGKKVDEKKIINNEAKEPTKKGKSKKKGITVFAVGAALVVGATGLSVYKAMPFSVDGTVLGISKKHSDFNTTDDELAKDDYVGVYNPLNKKIEQVQIGMAIDRLDKICIDCDEMQYVSGLECIEKDKCKLSDEDKLAVISDYLENGIDEYINSYENEKDELKRKKYGLYLIAIGEYQNSWMSENGLPLSLSLLKRTLEPNILAAYNKACSSDENYRVNLDTKCGTVLIVDDSTGADVKFKMCGLVNNEYYNAHSIYKEVKSKVESKKHGKLDDIVGLSSDVRIIIIKKL